MLNNLLLYLQEAFFIKRWSETEEKHLNSYLVHLSKYTEQKASSLRQTVSRIRRFFQMAFVVVMLPMVPTEAAMARIIDGVDTSKAIGVRDHRGAELRLRSIAPNSDRERDADTDQRDGGDLDARVPIRSLRQPDIP